MNRSRERERTEREREPSFSSGENAAAHYLLPGGGRTQLFKCPMYYYVHTIIFKSNAFTLTSFIFLFAFVFIDLIPAAGRLSPVPFYRVANSRSQQETKVIENLIHYSLYDCWSEDDDDDYYSLFI